jgi:hypothetical protein
MNSHIAPLIYLYYIIMNEHEQYWITFVPSAWQKAKVQAWRTSEYKSAWTVQGIRKINKYHPNIAAKNIVKNIHKI